MCDYDGKICLNAEIRVVMHQERLIVGDLTTVAEFLSTVAGKRIPVRVGLTIVGFVSDFRIVEDKVIGIFRENKS